MVITYYGVSCYKVQFGDTIIAFNPVSKQSDYKASTFGADIALISVNKPDYNGREQVAYGSREPFLIEGPGEYEVGGIYVRGFGVPQEWEGGGKKEKGTVINTVYSVLFEGVNLCHLGALQKEALDPQITESLGEIDLLFVPVFGGNTLGPAGAAKVATTLAPKLIIPMYADMGGGKATLAQFLKESGGEGAETVEKLTLKKKDLDGKEGDVLVIKPVA